MTEQITVKLTEEELKQIQMEKEEEMVEKARKAAQIISYFVKAFSGQPLEEGDVITRLINTKELVERSRFPTYPLIAKQVYCRLVAELNPNYETYRRYADLEAQALIAYKGLNWDAYVEMAKGAAGPPEQQFIIGIPQREQRQEQPAPKRHFWQRKPKQEETEFAE